MVKRVVLLSFIIALVSSCANKDKDLRHALELLTRIDSTYAEATRKNPELLDITYYYPFVYHGSELFFIGDSLFIPDTINFSQNKIDSIINYHRPKRPLKIFIDWAHGIRASTPGEGMVRYYECFKRPFEPYSGGSICPVCCRPRKMNSQDIDIIEDIEREYYSKLRKIRIVRLSSLNKAGSNDFNVTPIGDTLINEKNVVFDQSYYRKNYSDLLDNKFLKMIHNSDSDLSNHYLFEAYYPYECVDSIRVLRRFIERDEHTLESSEIDRIISDRILRNIE